jgi:hypothetical protein
MLAPSMTDTAVASWRRGVGTMLEVTTISSVGSALASCAPASVASQAEPVSVAAASVLQVLWNAMTAS